MSGLPWLAAGGHHQDESGFQARGTALSSPLSEFGGGSRSCAASTPSLRAADAIVSSVGRGWVATTFAEATRAGGVGVERSAGALLVVAGMPVWIAPSQSRFDADLRPTFVRNPSGPDQMWTSPRCRPAVKRIRAPVELVDLDPASRAVPDLDSDVQAVRLSAG
jgi:hypothetical protein